MGPQGHAFRPSSSSCPLSWDSWGQFMWLSGVFLQGAGGHPGIAAQLQDHFLVGAQECQILVVLEGSQRGHDDYL
jgi:hypothetical protein